MFTVIQIQAAQILLSMTWLIADTSQSSYIYQLTENTVREFRQRSTIS